MIREGEGFNPTCPGAAKLCLGGSFIAVGMPMANTASNPGYLHRNNEGKKSLTFLIVLMKKSSISIDNTWLGTMSFSFRMTPSHLLTRLWPRGKPSRVFQPPQHEGNFCPNQTTGVNCRWNVSAPEGIFVKAGLALTSWWFPPQSSSLQLGQQMPLILV